MFAFLAIVVLRKENSGDPSGSASRHPEGRPRLAGILITPIRLAWNTFLLLVLVNNGKHIANSGEVTNKQNLLAADCTCSERCFSYVGTDELTGSSERPCLSNTTV